MDVGNYQARAQKNIENWINLCEYGGYVTNIYDYCFLNIFIII
jgi:hypothetical protein